MTIDKERLAEMDRRYNETCDSYDEAYKPLCDAFKAEGIDASVWQTGGMCMLIGISLDPQGSTYAMIGASNTGPLPLDPTEVESYEVGLYLDEDESEGYMLLPFNRWGTKGNDVAAFVAWLAPLLKRLWKD